jgi:hypothetical protein
MTLPGSVINNGQRVLGGFVFPNQFEVEKQGPLDTRAVVGSVEELLEPERRDGSPKYEYYGMLVTVSGDGDSSNDGVYRLKESGDPRVIEGWEKLGTGSGDDSFITSGTITDSILTLNYNDDKDPLTINFEECCGGGLSELYISAFEIPTVETVGGITNGTPVQNLIGKTFSEIFDLMFFPTQTPSGSYKAPTYDNGVGTLFEIGDTVELTHTTSASRGGWSPSTYAGGVTQPTHYTGPVTNAEIIYDGAGSTSVLGVELYNSTDGITIDNPSETYTIVSGSQGWKLEVTFADGGDPFDSTGEIILNGGFGSSTRPSSRDGMVGSYPIYVIDDDGSFNEILLDHTQISTLTLTMTYTEIKSGTPRFEFHIPDVYGEPSSVIQIVPGLPPSAEMLFGANKAVDKSDITKTTNHDTNVPYNKIVHVAPGKQGVSDFVIKF